MYAHTTVADLMSPYQKYPKTIQTAILLVETNPRFRGLTLSMKSVLKTLITRVSKTDGTTPIRARLDLVAEQADVSTKTVQRTVSALRAAGWMDKVSEGRSEHGVFTSRRYQFSADLCSIVGLQVKGAVSQKTNLSDGAVYVDLSFKEDHQEVLLQKRIENPEANKVSLPPELQPIIDLGIKDTGVAKLRGMAYAKGHNLADIFTVAKKRITELKASGGRVYCYLAAMIDNPKATDYAAKASQIERSGVVAAIAGKSKDRARQYAHKRFAGSNGLIVRIFDGNADVSRDRTPICMVGGRDMDTIYDDIESGKLVEVAQ